MEIEQTFTAFVIEIKSQIKAAQYKALHVVNIEQIALYWNIGKTIVEKQLQHNWGKSVVEMLALELQKEFVGINGFSARNLWRMRTLYEQYSQSTLILPPVVAEIPWTHNILILEKCKDENERFYYIKMTAANAWSKTLLINAIDAQSYQNTVVSQHNFENAIAKSNTQSADFLLKDDYLFDFLNLAEPHSEAELEQAILSNIRNFLTSLGGDFSFIGNQFPISIDNKTFEVDLLLFHRELQCLVAIDLKIQEFMPEFAGKMNFYLSALNSNIKKQHEAPSIGIIICKSKNRTVVEFALQDVSKPIGIATYSLSHKLPTNLQQFFPTNQQFVERVESITNYIKNKKP